MSKSRLKIRAQHAALAVLWATFSFLTLLSPAAAQADFTLQASAFSPDAVAPGGTSSSNITVGIVNGFAGTVDLTCQVSSNQTTTSPPTCAVSPTRVTPPANAAVTITTTTQTTTVGYTITITGTATAVPADTHTTPPQNLTVLAVTAQFTITVQSAVVPSSVPAGSGSQGVILIDPINGYSSPTTQIGGHTVGGITLSCVSITPLVTIPPVCSFNPPSPPVTGVPVTSTLTISTYGPIATTSAVAHPRAVWALWLPLPMLALVGLGAAVGGKQSRKAWGLLALFIVSGAIFLMPACSNIAVTTITPNGITPANTYSFTVQGVDVNGEVSSNTSSAAGANPTVTLTVTKPTN